MAWPIAGSPCPPCCSKFIWRLLLLLLIISTISFVIALVVIVITTGYHEPNFRFDSASFTSLNNVIGPNLTANFNITFTVTNPNKKYNISYETIDATLYYGDCEYNRYSRFDYCAALASTRLPPFLQLIRSHFTLPIQIKVIDKFVGNDIVASRARESIEFGFKLNIRFRIAGNMNRVQVALYEQKINMQFYCQRLSFVFKSNNSTFASGYCLFDPIIKFG